MFKSNILFSGYYGFNNSGDDAFVEVASWGANKIWKNNHVRFLIKENQKPITVTPIKAFPLSIPKTFGLQQKILINSTQNFILAGGSTLNDVIENQPNKFQSSLLKEKKVDFKLGGIGLSIGPFRNINAEKSVINYLKKFDFLALRDKRSFEFASSLDLNCEPVDAFDLAAILPSIYSNSNQIKSNFNFSEKKVIAISLCNYESYIFNGNLENEKRRNLELLQLIQKISLQHNNLHFKFIVFNGNLNNGDLSITKEFVSKIDFKFNSFEIVNYNPSVKTVYQTIASADVVLTVRLHAAIFACFAHVPFILIEYHQKCSDFLNDIGYNEDSRFFDFEINQEIAIDKLNQYLNNKVNFVEPKYIDQMQKKAFLNFSTINV